MFKDKYFRVCLIVTLLCLIAWFRWGSPVVHLKKNSSEYIIIPQGNTTIKSSGEARDSQWISTRDDICTFNVFRKYNRQRHFFPGSGHWDNKDTPHYILDWCKLENKILFRDRIDTCLLQANISSILILGDSQGNQAFVSLKKLMNSGENIKCKQVGDGKKHYDNIKNQLDPSLTIINKQGQNKDANKHVICHVTSSKMSHDINMEFILGINLIDSLITVIDRKTNSTNNGASTTQEFYLKYFLRDRLPDLLLYFTPFNHAMYATLEGYVQQMKALKTVLDKYIPSTSKVVFIPSFKESPSKYPTAGVMKGISSRFPPGFRNERILAMNKAFYHTMEEDLISSSTHRYGFVDQYEMSEGRDAWNSDGQHMKSVWYDSAMSLLWQLICNSVQLDQF